LVGEAEGRRLREFFLNKEFPELCFQKMLKFPPATRRAPFGELVL
jgi:hypothetical protein